MTELLFFFKLLIVFISVLLVIGTIYVLQKGNFIRLRREELSWLRKDAQVPEESPAEQREEELYVSWQYLYDRLNEEQVEPREIVLQAEQLFTGALAAHAVEVPIEGELAEVQGQVALLKRNSHLPVSSAEARRMVEVYEQALKAAGIFSASN